MPARSVRPMVAGATHGAIAQTPMPQTPITKILAVGTFVPGTDMSQAALGQKRTLMHSIYDVRFTPKSGHWLRVIGTSALRQ